MRINKYVAQATGLSRRAADRAVQEGRVSIDGQVAKLGSEVEDGPIVELDHLPLTISPEHTTLILNKPAGYVVSRDGQGSKTIYDLLSEEYRSLKPVGRLDKDSSGLLLLTNDGNLANELTHPRYAKTKVYEIELDKPLEPLHQQMISDRGIQLEDGLSKLLLQKLDETGLKLQATMSEGRNRQIRRTFAALGYEVITLHRTRFGNFSLDGLSQGSVHHVVEHT